MTDTLFQKLEERMLLVFTELEVLRNENAELKSEREKNMQKLQSLVSLFETINATDNAAENAENLMQNMAVAVGKPMLVQG